MCWSMVTVDSTAAYNKCLKLTSKLKQSVFQSDLLTMLHYIIITFFMWLLWYQTLSPFCVHATLKSCTWCARLQTGCIVTNKLMIRTTLSSYQVGRACAMGHKLHTLSANTIARPAWDAQWSAHQLCLATILLAPWPPFIISLPNDHQHLSQNYQAMANKYSCYIPLYSGIYSAPTPGNEQWLHCILQVMHSHQSRGSSSISLWLFQALINNFCCSKTKRVT